MPSGIDAFTELASFVPEAPSSGMSGLSSFFGAGGGLDKFANLMNPAMKDSGLPPYLKALLGSKISFANKNAAFSMGGPPNNGGDDEMMTMLRDMMKSGVGGSSPTTIENKVPSTEIRTRPKPLKYDPLDAAIPSGGGSSWGPRFLPTQNAPGVPPGFPGLQDPFGIGQFPLANY